MHAPTRSESNLNVALPSVFGIITHAEPCSDVGLNTGIPGGTLPSPVCEFLLSLALKLCDNEH